MPEELLVLFVGSDGAATALSDLLSESGVTARVAHVSDWSGLQSVTGGWDVVVGGAPGAPCDAAALREWLGEAAGIPVFAFCEARDAARRAESGDPASPIEWLEPHEYSALPALLRGLIHVAGLRIQREVLEARLRGVDARSRQAGRLEVVGQMACGLAHEFNNLLTVISGYGEQLLARANGDESLTRLIEPLRQAGLRGADLTQRMLAFSRQPEGDVGHTNVNGVAREAAAMLAPLLGEQIALDLVLDPTVPRVRGTAGQLIEVVTNLAINGRDAMPEGGTLTLSTHWRPGDAGQDGAVELVVRDTGVGMDAATLERAREPFFTTKPSGRGTGLGLSLVNDIVEQAGGEMVIETELGRGTAVRMRLVPSGEPEPEVAPTPAPDATAHTGFETVLLVEDDASVREIVSQFLSSAGYEVIEASDAAEAVALVKDTTRCVDLLLTDIVLPGVGGPQLAGLVREHASGIRTLFISGYPSEMLGSGGDATPVFLSKPFSRSSLLQAVRRCLTAPRYRQARR